MEFKADEYPLIHYKRHPELVKALIANYILRANGLEPDVWSSIEDELMEACRAEGINWAYGTLLTKPLISAHNNHTEAHGN